MGRSRGKKQLHRCQLPQNIDNWQSDQDSLNCPDQPRPVRHPVLHLARLHVQTHHSERQRRLVLHASGFYPYIFQRLRLDQIYQHRLPRSQLPVDSLNQLRQLMVTGSLFHRQRQCLRLSEEITIRVQTHLPGCFQQLRRYQ